jgi:DNA-directed RNA polymerase specialized sigma24 family protein
MLVDIIIQAQTGDNEASLFLLEKFKPLLKKYTYRLKYDDAYNDLLLDFYELIKNINTGSFYETCDGSIVSYIQKSTYSHYIDRSKSNKIHNKAIVTFSQLSENENHYLEAASASFDDYSELLILNLDKILNHYELLIIYWIYVLGYSSTDIAQIKGTSRQAINQTKNRALKKLKNAFAV